jgi:Txe/YoeB family toxin of Txe-Axe toxin-antitoxin module
MGSRVLPGAERQSAAEEFFESCPTKVEANFNAVLEAVRRAPPPAFSGGGKWEAMHGKMAGYYEIRATGLAAGTTGCSADSRTGAARSWRGLASTGRRSSSSTAW